MSDTARELLARDPVRPKHRVEYAALRAALAGGMLLGDRAAARLGAALGRAGYPLGIKRKVVERNLRIAFPDADEETIERIARASYEHLGRETMMMLRLSSMSRERLLELASLADEVPLIEARARGTGLILVAGHLGNWEVGAAVVAALGYPMDVIAKRAANPLFYRRVLAARERLGVRVIDFQVAPRHALRSLRAGRCVAFAADQHAGRAGLPVPFFGRPASTYRGPALMALRTGAPMYLCLPLRRPDGTYRVEVERIDTTPGGDMEADVLRITTSYTARLEAAVRVHPEQYVWHHRRWRLPAPAADAGREPEAPPAV